MLRARYSWAFTAVEMLCAFLVLSSWAAAAPRKLTVDEARQLASQALDPAQAKLPGLTFQPMTNNNFPDFYSFEILWDNPIPDGSTVVDDLSVDPKTGDVWKRGGCTASSADLAKMQKDFRKRLGLSDKEYQKVRHPGPPC